MASKIRSIRNLLVWPMALVGPVLGCVIAPSASADQHSASATATDLTSWISGRVAKMDASDPYRVPTSYERSVGVTALQDEENGSLGGKDDQDARKIGITPSSGTDSSTGRRYVMLSSEPDTDRSWGTVIVDKSAPLHLVIEVPHPKDDVNTPAIGLDLFRKVPGSALIIAGSSRHAGSGDDADVAHAPTSVFQSYAGHLARQTGREVQIHGFADASLPGTDAIPSPGATIPTSLHSNVATALSAYGLKVCKGWVSYCGDLRGKTNVQSKAAKERGSRFLHLELSSTVRENATKRSQVAHAIARTWG